MLCNVCKDRLEGMWDPSRSTRLCLLTDFLALRRRPSSQMDDRFASIRASTYVYGYHKTRASLVASIESGCAVCSRYDSNHDQELNPAIEKLGFFSIFCLVHWPSSKKENTDLIMFVWQGTGESGNRFLPVGDPEYDRNLNFDVGSSTNNPKTWSIIETWVHSCLESHVQCKQPKTSPSYRPTRLLKLNGTHTFRLVCGAECPSTIEYAALSYCWGAKPVHSLLRLLQSTIGALSQEQPVERLPKTFRDAMHIIQRFGISYLWIDRLCIFQDSAEDWRIEASTMQDVYRNALLTVSALGARDDDGGCFFQRDASTVNPTVLRLKLEEDGDERPFRAAWEKGWAWRRCFLNEPLVQRSWVVQERLLAPRTLHFGSRQVFWECREAECCETQPENIYLDDMEDPSYYQGAKAQQASGRPHEPFLWKQLLDVQTRLLCDTRNSYEQLFSEWNRMVTYYTGRELTVASDKLAALSGLANDMKARLQQLKPGPHRYLAGLWEEKLMTTLAWSVKGPGKRPSEYRAPSWSWACLDGQVSDLGGRRIMEKNTRIFTSMISGKTVPLGKDACDTGEVQGGMLTLKGPCEHVLMDLGEADFIPETPTENMRSIRGLRRPNGQGLIELPKGMTRARATFDTLEDIKEQALLLWVCAHDTFGPNVFFCYGLLLAVRDNNEYQRLGATFFMLESWEDAEALVGQFPQREVSIV